MIHEVRSKIIAALAQADIHYDEKCDQAEDAPREFDPQNYLDDFKAVAIGVTGDYFDDSGLSTTDFTVLLDGRFLLHFILNLHAYCNDESDANVSMDIKDLGECPDAAIKAAYAAFKEEVNRIAMEAVWRVFHCTSAHSLDQSEELTFYQDLAKTMHAGIDEQMQNFKSIRLEHTDDEQVEHAALLVPENIPWLDLKKPLRRTDNLAEIPYLGRTSVGRIISEDEAGEAFSPDERDLENIPE